MSSKEMIYELVEKILTIENEISLLQEDKKGILADHKDKLDIKAFNAALRVARIKSKLSNTSELEFDNLLSSVEDKICIKPIV